MSKSKLERLIELDAYAEKIGLSIGTLPLSDAIGLQVKIEKLISDVLEELNIVDKLEQEDFVGAAAGLKDSKWYTQVGTRAQEIVSLVAQAGSGKGEKIAMASNTLAAGQREQQKPSTPVVVNKPKIGRAHV